MPSSSATARRLRPLACARRTASARNSGVKCFLSSAIGDLLLHGKSSPLPRSKSGKDQTLVAGAADLGLQGARQVAAAWRSQNLGQLPLQRPALGGQG